MWIPDWLEEIVKAGIEVTIIRSDKYFDGYYFDLNSGAKSHMHLYRHSDGEWCIDMRYDKSMMVQNLEDAMTAFLNCYRIRQFGSEKWLDFLVSKGRLKKTVIEQKPIIKYE